MAGSLIWYNGGLLSPGSGALTDDPSCCCAESCCDILLNFATLKVTVNCGGDEVVFHPTGGSENCPTGVGWDGEEQTFTEFTMADFTFCCAENEEGIPVYRVTASLASSSPCSQQIDEEITQPAPCCPLDITFDVTPGECCTSMTIRVQTEDDVECPE